MVATSLDASTVLTFAVLGFVGVRLVGGARAARSSAGRRLVGEVRRRIGWRHLVPVVPLLTVILVVAWALMLVPGLDVGWWSALGGEGNPAFGSSEETAGTVWEWLVPAVFLVLLVPAIPLFAHAEERLFRTGAERRTPMRRAGRSLAFGLVHAVVGIPIGAALALSIGGAWFTHVYLRERRRTGSAREATLESTAAHTVYNLAIVGLVVVALLSLALGWA